MKKLISIFGIIVIIISIVTLATGAADLMEEEIEEGIAEGSPLENFVLKNGLTGENVSFEREIKGKYKYSAIIFANTSCGSCRKELDTLSKLSTKYKDFATYVVLVDMNGDEIIGPFTKEFKFNVTYLMDPDFTIPPIYGFYFTPSLVIIDDKGIIVYKKGGYSIIKDENIVKNKVEELLN